MSDLELTGREKDVLKSGLYYAREDFKDALIAAVNTFDSEAEVHRRFAPGSYGAHELTDRAHVIRENWSNYVLDHPTLALNEEAYRMACMAEALMGEVYQIVACAERTVNDENDE